MLIGHDDDHKDDDGNLKVTLHHNWFTGQTRNPRVRYGVVHVVNNLYYKNKVIGIGAAYHSTIHSENNYFYKSAKPYDNNYGEDPEDRGVIYSVGDKLDDITDLRVDEYKKENRLDELPYTNYPVDASDKVKAIVEKGAGVLKNSKYTEDDTEDDTEDEDESKKDDDSTDDESNNGEGDGIKGDEDGDKDDVYKLLKKIQVLNNKSYKSFKKIQKGRKKGAMRGLAEDSRQYCHELNSIVEDFLQNIYVSEM
jgi:pectate lyase